MQQITGKFICLILFLTIFACQRGSDLEGAHLQVINSKNLMVLDEKEVTLPGSEDPNARIFYLVRHAEKRSEGDNPILTDEGIERSKRLSSILADTRLDLCYSTNYIRTLMTAEPIAKLKKIGISQYDAKELKAFSNKLKTDPKAHRILIVGHSNTTPALVNLLSGNTVYENINEQVYDDFFVVSLEEGKPAKVLKLKY